MNTQIVTRPMLSARRLPGRVVFPILATPKLDGIRCLKLGGRALTRSFKPIVNNFAREWIEANVADGCDGELMLRGSNFCETASGLGRRDGFPNFVFCVFDYVQDTAAPYHRRVESLALLPTPDRVEKILPTPIHDFAELNAYEEKCLGEGYEGVMVRAPDGPYKCGRSTERECFLAKIKRFEDSEGVILDTYERMSNQNEAGVDAFGHIKRGVSLSAMVGRGELGGFVVRALDSGVEFRLAYNHRAGGNCAGLLWNRKDSLVGQAVKYRHQPSGAKEAPRFPQFIGWRPSWD
jgi:DNA ligase-1